MSLGTRPKRLDGALRLLKLDVDKIKDDQIKDLQTELGMAVLMITHDLGVVANMADEIVVMYHGKLVEEGSTAQVFETPSEDYTRSLLAAIPGANAA